MLYFYECLACCTSMHSYICIVASHLGTIDEPYEGRAMNHMKDVLLEPNPKTMLVDISRMTDGWNPMCMTKGRCSPSEYHLTNTDLVLIPGKPRCTSYYFKFMTHIYVSNTCALGLGIVWNSTCMIPRFPGVILVCIG